MRVTAPDVLNQRLFRRESYIARRLARPRKGKSKTGLRTPTCGERVQKQSRRTAKRVFFFPSFFLRIRMVRLKWWT